MPTDRPALPFRNDTLLGVCEGLGEEFGFHPNWLRVALAALLLASPAVSIAAYLALGTVLFISRLAFPTQAPAPAAAPPDADVANDPAPVPLPLPLAA